jgi:hypothetical protein
VLHVILGGAALQGCDNCIILSSALAAAETLKAHHEREAHGFTFCGGIWVSVRKIRRARTARSGRTT